LKSKIKINYHTRNGTLFRANKCDGIHSIVPGSSLHQNAVRARKYTHWKCSILHEEAGGIEEDIEMCKKDDF
jgi:hypothetical protein